AIISRPAGAHHSPMATIDCPSPYPVSVGSMRIWGTSSAWKYIEKPIRAATMLVTRTRFPFETRRSTSGAGDLSSHRPHTTNATIETANRIGIVAPVQPQSPPLDIASNPRSEERRVGRESRHWTQREQEYNNTDAE